MGTTAAMYIGRVYAGRTPRIFLNAMHLPTALATAFNTCSFTDSRESSVIPKIRFDAIVLLPNTKCSMVLGLVETARRS